MTGFLSFSHCHAQDGFNRIYLKAVKTISLNGMGTEALQMDINAVDTILYLASPETNTVFLINPLTGGQILPFHNIHGLKRVSYISKQNELFVSTGTSKCFFYNGTSIQRTHKIQLMSPSEAIYYDSTSDQIYVGYEEGVKRINATTHKLTGFIPLYTEPKSIVHDAGKNRLYINSPDVHSVSAIDLDIFKVAAEWESDEPLIDDIALDAANERLFLASKKKAELISINTKTGKRTIISVTISVKRMHIDSQSRLLYLIGDNDVLVYYVGFSKLTQILSTKIVGRIRSSFLSTELKLLVIARELSPKADNDLLVYQIGKN